MKPIILMTIYRRYYELDHNLPIIVDKLKREFGYKPPIVVLWNRPEQCRKWVLEKHIENGNIDVLIERDSAPDELLMSHSYAESVNIRQALHLIKNNYANDEHYVTFHTVDIVPQDGVYSELDRIINSGEPRIIVRWYNSIAHHCFHTNFFVTVLDAAYWIPISKNNIDVLEKAWGDYIGTDYNDNCCLNNLNNKLFIHAHESEQFAPYPAKTSISLYLCNVPTRFEIFKLWCIQKIGRIKKWLRL